MPIPESLNARIAVAKGWTWREDTVLIWGNFGEMQALRSHWRNPYDKPAICPDYVDTLEGVAELMKDLDETQRWFSWGYNIYTHRYVCIEDDTEVASSPEERPGDCAGKAWMSVFGKESNG